MSFRFFLEQLQRLPSFDLLGQACSRLSKNCATWVERYSDQQENIVHNIQAVSEEDFLERFSLMNPKVDFE